MQTTTPKVGDVLKLGGHYAYLGTVVVVEVNPPMGYMIVKNASGQHFNLSGLAL